MDDTELLGLLDATPADELNDILSSLSPDTLARLGDWLTDITPPSQATYVDADHPIDLARRLLPGWRDRDHLQLLSARCAEWCREGRRGIVNIPPQYGKSATVARWTPTWYLDRWPGRSVIMTSYAESLIRDRSREVRDTFTTADGLHTSVRRGVATQTRWETIDGGGMVAAGLHGTITGRGAHLFIIDDPFKGWEEAHSRAARDRVWNIWRAVGATRLAPGAAVILVMTRWHEDDLAGRLKSDEYEGDPDEWEVLRIPALSEGADVDPLGRPEGDPLIRPDVDQTDDEAREWLESKKEIGSYLYAAIYQQRPGAAQGTIFLRAWWQYFTTGDGQAPHRNGTVVADRQTFPVDEMQIVQSWDMSFKEAADTSYVVGQVWGTHPSAPAWRFLLDQRRDRMGFSQTKQAVAAMRDRWPKSQAIWVEDKANGPAVIDELKSSIGGLIPVNPQGSKESRAWAIQGTVEAGNVWLPSPAVASWVPVYTDELAEFPNAAHDDQVDATTQALLQLRDRSAPGRGSSPAGHRLPGTQRGSSGLRILGGRR